jgi:hypothetical protein
VPTDKLTIGAIDHMANTIYTQGLNCQKISGGLTSAYSLSLSLHTGDSASLTTAGVETDPPRVSQGILFWGVEQASGGGVQPPNPPAIQTLYIRDDRVQLMLNVSFVANSWPSQGSTFKWLYD